jgi:putative transposase
MKYCPQFPERFGCIQDTRGFCGNFFGYYNDEHRHSGIGLMTPAMVHYGQAEHVLATRQETLLAAYRVHPERFVRRPPQPPVLPRQAWINPPVQRAANSGQPVIVTPSSRSLQVAL